VCPGAHHHQICIDQPVTCRIACSRTIDRPGVDACLSSDHECLAHGGRRQCRITAMPVGPTEGRRAAQPPAVLRNRQPCCATAQGLGSSPTASAEARARARSPGGTCNRWTRNRRTRSYALASGHRAAYGVVDRGGVPVGCEPRPWAEHWPDDPVFLSVASCAQARAGPWIPRTSIGGTFELGASGHLRPPILLSALTSRPSPQSRSRALPDDGRLRRSGREQRNSSLHRGATVPEMPYAPSTIVRTELVLVPSP
jgi:hypothetical protein